MTSSTSATSSGSRALVTSSSRSRSGCIASARTIATRCCCPPDSRSGYSMPLVGEPEPFEQRRCLRVRVIARASQHLSRRERHVAQHGHVREQVERLEDDPDAPPDPVDVDAPGGDLLALHDDPPRIDRLEQVDAAQERGLPRPGRADQADDLVLGDGQVDALAAPPGRRTTCGGPRSGAPRPVAVNARPPTPGAGRGQPASPRSEPSGSVRTRKISAVIT